MSTSLTSTTIRVRAQARSTAWNKFIYVAVVVAAALVGMVTAGGPATLLTVPTMFVVYVAAHFALGQRTIEATTDEVTIRSGGPRGRILAVVQASTITLVRSRQCHLDAAEMTVWFNRRDWDKLANAVGRRSNPD